MPMLLKSFPICNRPCHQNESLQCLKQKSESKANHRVYITGKTDLPWTFRQTKRTTSQGMNTQEHSQCNLQCLFCLAATSFQSLQDLGQIGHMFSAIEPTIIYNLYQFIILHLVFLYFPYVSIFPPRWTYHFRHGTSKCANVQEAPMPSRAFTTLPGCLELRGSTSWFCQHKGSWHQSVTQRKAASF